MVSSRTQGPSIADFRFADPSIAVSTFRQVRADAEEGRRQREAMRRNQEERQLDERLRSNLRDFDPNAPVETEAGTGRQTLPPAQALEQRVGSTLAQSPGGGEALLNLRMEQAQRGREEEQARLARAQERQDEAEDQIHDLMKQGNVGSARALARQIGMQVPEEFFSSAEKAQDFGHVLDVVKANEHDPEYGHRLVKAFHETGSIEKAIQTSGRPKPKQGDRSAERVAIKLTEAFADQYPPPSPEEITAYYQKTLSGLQAGGTQPRATEGAPGAGTMPVGQEPGQAGQPPTPRGETGAMTMPQGAQVPPEVDRRFRQQTIEAPIESFFPQGSEVPAQWRARQQLQQPQQQPAATPRPQAAAPQPRPQQPTAPTQPTQPQQQAGGQIGTEQNPATPTTLEEFEALPPGTIYKDPGDQRLYVIQE